MARYSISENILTRMGDALRVHFGDYKTEGTTEFKSETPLVFNTPNFTSFEGNTESIYWVRSESKISFYAHTFIFHGAASIKVAISYNTGVHSSGDSPISEFIWIAPGLHKRYDAHEPGEYLQYTSAEENADGWYYCWICGSTDVHINNQGKIVCSHCYDVDTDGSKIYDTEAWFQPSPLTYEEYEFQGDSITVYPEFYDDTYTNGFYMEIRAYDADGNELKMYDLTTGKIPNEWSPEEMITAVEKLNYFPNGEEVEF